MAQRHVRRRPHDRHRCPQLVRGIGHEAPLRAQRALQAAEQVVECVAQSAELVVGVRDGQPDSRGKVRDLPCLPRHHPHRLKRPAGNQPATGAGKGQRNRDAVRECAAQDRPLSVYRE